MSSASPQERQENMLAALDTGALHDVGAWLTELLASDIAHLLESNPPPRRGIIWKLLTPEDRGEVLQYLGEDLRSELLQDFEAKDIVQLVDEMNSDDFADILQDLPETVLNQVLDSLTDQNRQRIEQVLHYSADTAGGLMDNQFVTVRPNINLETVLRYLRRYTELPENLDSLCVVNRKGALVGLLPIHVLLVRPTDSHVRDHMLTSFDIIEAHMPSSAVATLFERHDLISAPVVNEIGQLVGRITIDDVVDVIRQEGNHNLLRLAGLDEESDTFAPVVKTAQRRAFWLGINLLTALIASAVIYMFEATIAAVVYLAAIMPIVASMGGIAGSQTLTLIIRSMALGHLNGSNWLWILSREVAVAALNGSLWAVVIGSITAIWFQDPWIGLILGIALIFNLLVAAVAGALLPLGMEKLKIDPALAGSVVLTTITDVLGFIAFLGMATIIYL